MSPSRPGFGGSAEHGGSANRRRAAERSQRAKNTALLRNSAVMAAGTGVSRALGFVRVWALSVAIGVSYDSADAFQLSNTLPNLLYMLTAGGMLNAVLVPQIVRATKSPDGGREYVNRLLTWSFLIIGAVAVIATASSSWLIPLMARTHDADFLKLAVVFAYWCVPQVMFYGLYTVFGQYLNAKGRFGAYMWAPVANNIVGLTGIGLFIIMYGAAGSPDQHPPESWTVAMIAVMAGSATLGIAAQAFILLPSLRRSGFRYRPTFGIRGVGLRSASNVAGWTFLSALVGQLAYLVSTWAATPFTEEAYVPGIAAIAVALLLMMLPHSLIGVSLVTAMFTPLSASARDGDWAAVRQSVSSGLRHVGVFNMVATAGLVALALPIAALFSDSRTEAGAVSWVIAARALGLVFFTAAYLLQRVCFAYEDAKTPFLTQVPSVVLVIAASLIATRLPVQWIATAVSLAWSAAALLNFALIAYVVQRQHGSLHGRQVIASHLRMLLAALVAGGVGILMAGRLLEMLDSQLPLRVAGMLTTLVAGVVIVAIYLVGLRLVRAPELETAVLMIRRRLGRRMRR